MTFGEWTTKTGFSPLGYFSPVHPFRFGRSSSGQKRAGCRVAGEYQFSRCGGLAHVVWVHWTMFDYGIVVSDRLRADSGRVVLLTYIRADLGCPAVLSTAAAVSARLWTFGNAPFEYMHRCLGHDVAHQQRSPIGWLLGGCAAWLVLLRSVAVLHLATHFRVVLFGSCWARNGNWSRQIKQKVARARWVRSHCDVGRVGQSVDGHFGGLLCIGDPSSIRPNGDCKAGVDIDCIDGSGDGNSCSVRF